MPKFLEKLKQAYKTAIENGFYMGPSSGGPVAPLYHAATHAETHGDPESAKLLRQMAAVGSVIGVEPMLAAPTIATAMTAADLLGSGIVYPFGQAALMAGSISDFYDMLKKSNKSKSTNINSDRNKNENQESASSNHTLKKLCGGLLMRKGGRIVEVPYYEDGTPKGGVPAALPNRGLKNYLSLILDRFRDAYDYFRYGGNLYLELTGWPTVARYLSGDPNTSAMEAMAAATIPGEAVAAKAGNEATNALLRAIDLLPVKRIKYPKRTAAAKAAKGKPPKEYIAVDPADMWEVIETGRVPVLNTAPGVVHKSPRFQAWQLSDQR